MEQHWEEAEKILSWREMQPGVYMYHGIEQRGTNDYGKPISVVTLEKDGITKMYYAPPPPPPFIVLEPEKLASYKLHQI